MTRFTSSILKLNLMTFNDFVFQMSKVLKDSTLNQLWWSLWSTIYRRPCPHWLFITAGEQLFADKHITVIRVPITTGFALQEVNDHWTYTGVHPSITQQAATHWGLCHQDFVLFPWDTQTQNLSGCSVAGLKKERGQWIETTNFDDHASWHSF